MGLGDSTTAGTPGFLSPVEAPPHGRGDERSQYVYWLRRARPEWTVLNRGVNRETAGAIAARFDRDVVRARPAVVVIIAGVNDVYGGADAGEVTQALREMYDRAAAASMRVVAGSIIPYDTATEAHNRTMHTINRWIAEESRRDSNVWFADTRAAAAAQDNPDRLAASPDGLHPDVEGYRRMAVALEGVVAQALEGKKR